MTISRQITGLKPGVCTSTTRPTPYEGMLIWETDTQLMAVYVNATIGWKYVDSTTYNLWVPFVTLGPGALVLTDQAQALQFFLNSTRMRMNLDLSGFSAVRFSVSVTVASTSVNTPKVLLRYLGTSSTVASDYLDIGTSEVSMSLTTLGPQATAWIPLVAGAKGPIILTLLMSGGDAVNDPSVSHVAAQFR